ncbi:MAG: 3-methyladenine DNA glycosylase 2 [Halopseudomonas sp.]|uniref:DNA-3-methyladenine glycosylase family protein n=1 Tax=Halopseudomonas sp. TaxID=2901191 RepID=UPI0030035F8E
MPPTTQLNTRVSLPADFRVADLLRFYRRDKQQLAERVTAHSIDKGLLLQGAPACLHMYLGQPGSAVISLHCDAAIELTQAELSDWGSHLLGLQQPVAAFARAHGSHLELGKLILASPGLRIPQAISPFEAACWAVIGQMISVEAATSIRRRLILQHGRSHSSGMHCHPDAQTLAALEAAALTSCGLSRSKAASLLLLATETAAGNLPLQHWSDAAHLEPQALAEQLLALRGIGPWTVSYILLRGFGLLDGSMHGDVVVRKRLQQLLARTDTPDQRQTAAWLADFSPYRALVAAHLWAMPAAGDSKEY